MLFIQELGLQNRIIAMASTLRFKLAAGSESWKLGCHTWRNPAPVTQLNTRWSRPHVRKLVVRAADGLEEGWEDDREQRRQRSSAKRVAAARQIEEKLSHTARRKRYVQEQLAKLDGQMKLAEAPPAKEQITEQERYMFMKLGLRMRARLLLGRRGVFDGTVENMHLHWKYRDLVKIIFKGPLFEAEQTAKILEVESGGVLVGLTETTKGQAMIFYRGKSYERPSVLRPRNLLTKRQAMQRSLEMQRKKSLEQHILKLEKEMGKLQVGLKYTREGDNDLERSFLSEAMGTELEDFDDDVENVEEEDDDVAKEGRRRSVVTLDPIFKAPPLSIPERIRMRQEALKKCDPLMINVGKSNMVSGLAKAVRLYFMKHPFAIVGVKGRAKGTPVAEIIQQIEEATGAVLVSREPNKLIIYRGWPSGEQRPDMVSEEDQPQEEVPQELRAAILSEEVRDPLDFSYLTREECALVGIEYTGNRHEEKDEEDEIRWKHIEAGVDMWTQELGEEEEEEEEGEIWSLTPPLELIE